MDNTNTNLDPNTNKPNKNLKQYLKGLLVGCLISFMAFSFIAVKYTKAYSLTIKEYAEINAIKEIADKYYYEDTKDKDYVEGMKKGIIEALKDPYSRYLNEKEFKEMMEKTTGEFVGIGVYVAPTKDNTIIILSPVKGSPAEKAGIKTGDIIIKVNGKAYDGKKLQDAVNAMKGKEGEKVDIELLTSENKKKKVSIVREKIHPQTVASKMINKKTGYLAIASFEENTSDEFRENIAKLKKSGAKSLIIDLRYNPGGILNQGLEIANQIMSKGIIVYTNNKYGQKKTYSANSSESINMPMVVLVNGSSASCAEILAGALQDNKKATLVGETTYGKGLVQAVLKLDKGGVVITTDQYFTPNGHTVNKTGIKPNVVVKEGLDKNKQDLQLKKAIEILSKK